MAHKSETEMIAKMRNTARFFTENRHISWVLLVGTILWGIFGYSTMPKRKDPDIPVRAAVAIANWPGAHAETMEERVTHAPKKPQAREARLNHARWRRRDDHIARSRRQGHRQRVRRHLAQAVEPP